MVEIGGAWFERMGCCAVDTEIWLKQATADWMGGGGFCALLSRVEKDGAEMTCIPRSWRLYCVE